MWSNTYKESKPIRETTASLSWWVNESKLIFTYDLAKKKITSSYHRTHYRKTVTTEECRKRGNFFYQFVGQSVQEVKWEDSQIVTWVGKQIEVIRSNEAWGRDEDTNSDLDSRSTRHPIHCIEQHHQYTVCSRYERPYHLVLVFGKSPEFRLSRYSTSTVANDGRKSTLPMLLKSRSLAVSLKLVVKLIFYDSIESKLIPFICISYSVYWIDSLFNCHSIIP